MYVLTEMSLCSCNEFSLPFSPRIARIPSWNWVDPKTTDGSTIFDAFPRLASRVSPTLASSPSPSSPATAALQDGYRRTRDGLPFSNFCAARRKPRNLFSNVMCRGQAGKDSRQGDSPQDLDISVFRFTLGIPGFDDSELPRLMGLFLGALLVLNHVLSSNTMTIEQLRSEVVGLLLAVVAISLPFLGQRLKGAKLKPASKIPSTRKQIFVLGDSLNQHQKEELAWASYALLRNANIIAVMFWFSGKLVCARGFWNTDMKPSSINELDWLQSIMTQTPLYTLSGQLYLPTGADEQGWSMILPGSTSLLAQTVTASSLNANKDPLMSSHGLLVVSDYQGISLKDRTWIALIGKKVVDILSSQICS